MLSDHGRLLPSVQDNSHGHTQILSFHIPVDIPDLESLHLHVMDHDLATLTECTLSFISHTALRHLTRRRYRVAEALWREALIDAVRFREWIVNVGQRPAVSRLAHMVIEMRWELHHVNRVVKQLHDEGGLEFSRGAVTVIDERMLLQLADFDDVYLSS